MDHPHRQVGWPGPLPCRSRRLGRELVLQREPRRFAPRASPLGLANAGRLPRRDLGDRSALEPQLGPAQVVGQVARPRSSTTTPTAPAPCGRVAGHPEGVHVPRAAAIAGHARDHRTPSAGGNGASPGRRQALVGPDHTGLAAAPAPAQGELAADDLLGAALDGLRRRGRDHRLSLVVSTALHPSRPLPRLRLQPRGPRPRYPVPGMWAIRCQREDGQRSGAG